MVPIHDNIIKVKSTNSVEFTNPYTQFMRQMQYESNRKLCRLKIDIRIVVTLAGIDMYTGAVKLLVNTKYIVNGLLNCIHDITDAREIFGAYIQVCVSQLNLS
ncbi:hypothetical protein F4703DRAFT_1793252 [Phycomyces blakesleeanus]